MHNKINKLTKAIIPFDAIETKMLPATKTIPKELLPIYDSRLLSIYERSHNR
jgi:UTP-glucose-1-phosphate uridylyltransferase